MFNVNWLSCQKFGISKQANVTDRKISRPRWKFWRIIFVIFWQHPLLKMAEFKKFCALEIFEEPNS